MPFFKFFFSPNYSFFETGIYVLFALFVFTEHYLYATLAVFFGGVVSLAASRYLYSHHDSN